MANNFANFNAAFPSGGGGGRPVNAAPMTMVPQRSTPMLGVGMAGSSMSAQLNLRPQEQAFYDQLFYSCDGSRTIGLVSGQAIKNLFTQSKLPKASLATIWNLSDRQKRKVLDLDDFYIACRLIAIAQQQLPITMQSLKAYQEIPLPMFEGNNMQPGFNANGGMPQPTLSLPMANSLSVPPRKSMPPMTSAGGGLGTGLPASTMQQPTNRGMDLMGSYGASTPAAPNTAFPVSLGRSGSVSVSPATTPMMSPNSAPLAPLQDEWSMTETEKSSYVALFSQADADADGFVGGKEANLFFKQSGLDNATLKQIWLLADVDRDNRLNPEEFSIAMHLTLRVRKGKTLPTVLPPSIDPRQKNTPPATSLPTSSSVGELDAKTGKQKLNLDLLPDLLPQPTSSQPDLMSSFDTSVPANSGVRAGTSKPSSRRASTSGGSNIDFGFGASQPVQPQQPPQFQPSLAIANSNGFGQPNTPSFGGGFASGFNAAPTQVPSSSSNSSGPQGYQMIEAIQTLDDRTSQLQQLTTQTDQVKRQQGVTESRLEEKLKAIEQVEVQIQSQTHLLDEQKKVLAGLEEQALAAETKLNESKGKLSEAQTTLQQGDSRAKELQDKAAQSKREQIEVDMKLTLLESELTSLRSQLKSLEDLKENQFNILQARKDQQNRLLHEKAEINELIAQSKSELQQIKDQAKVIKDGLESSQEQVDELQVMLKEHQEIVKQERIKPSVVSGSKTNFSPPSATNAQKSPVVDRAGAGFSPPPVVASNVHLNPVAKAKAAAFSFGDDDAYNIDDIALPSFEPKPITPTPTAATASSANPTTLKVTTTTPTVASAPTHVKNPSSVPQIIDKFNSLAVESATAAASSHSRKSSVVASSPASVTNTSANAATAAVSVPPPTSSSPQLKPTAAAVPPAIHTSTPSMTRDPFDEPANSAVSTSAPPPTVLSPPGPEVPTFPTALAGTGAPPAFVSPTASVTSNSSNPWSDDDASDPFGASSLPTATIQASTAAQAAFGEVDENDPFGGPSTIQATTTISSPGAASVFGEDDPFGAPAPVIAPTATKPNTTVPASATVPPPSTHTQSTPSITTASVPAPTTAATSPSSAFDADFDDDDFPAPVVAAKSTNGTAPSEVKPSASVSLSVNNGTTSTAPTAAAPVTTAPKSGAAAAFDSAMAEDWAAFD